MWQRSRDREEVLGGIERGDGRGRRRGGRIREARGGRRGGGGRRRGGIVRGRGGPGRRGIGERVGEVVKHKDVWWSVMLETWRLYVLTARSPERIPSPPLPLETPGPEGLRGRRCGRPHLHRPPSPNLPRRRGCRGGGRVWGGREVEEWGEAKFRWFPCGLQRPWLWSLSSVIGLLLK